MGVPRGTCMGSFSSRSPSVTHFRQVRAAQSAVLSAFGDSRCLFFREIIRSRDSSPETAPGRLLRHGQETSSEGFGRGAPGGPNATEFSLGTIFKKKPKLPVNMLQGVAILLKICYKRRPHAGVTSNP